MIRRVADVSTASVDAFRLYTQGAEAFTNARTDDARASLEEAVRIDPAFAEAYLLLTSVESFSGRPARRREYLRKAAENSHRLSEPRRLHLDILLARDARNVQEAARAIDDLIAKFPDTEAAYTVAARLFGDDLGDTEKLLQVIKTGVTALPASPSLRNEYGYALLRAGSYADAIREFEKYVELAPREANPYDSLADAYLASGSVERAIASYSRALELNPRFGSRLGLSWCFAVLGRYDEALAAKPQAKTVEGFLLSRLGRYADATEVIAGKLQAEHERSPGEQAVHMLVSAVLALEQREYGRVLRAAAAAEQVLITDMPISQARHRVLAQVLSGLGELGAGRTDAARTRLPLVRQLYRPAVHEEKLWYQALEGEIALATGDLERASASFAAGEPSRRQPMMWRVGATTVLSNSFPFRDGAARVAIARGDRRGAIQAYRRLLSYDAESKFIAVFEPRYVLQIARLLDQLGDKPEALKEYERFLQFWKNADANLPELAEARRAVSRLRAVG